MIKITLKTLTGAVYATKTYKTVNNPYWRTRAHNWKNRQDLKYGACLAMVEEEIN